MICIEFEIYKLNWISKRNRNLKKNLFLRTNPGFINSCELLLRYLTETWNFRMQKIHRNRLYRPLCPTSATVMGKGPKKASARQRERRNPEIIIIMYTRRVSRRSVIMKRVLWLGNANKWRIAKSRYIAKVRLAQNYAFAGGCRGKDEAVCETSSVCKTCFYTEKP